jgi:peptidoglycan/xylan/chitin deacetylase (PgdA/CDA1 family)
VGGVAGGAELVNRRTWWTVKVGVAIVARRLGLVRLLLHAQRKRPLLLRYHRIYPDGTEPFYELGIPRSIFEAQLDFLRRHFRVMSLGEICDALKDPARALPERALAITFDDGYADNYTQAFPALRARGLPATIFVCPDQIEQRGAFWWDRLARAVFAQRPETVTVDLGRGPQSFLLNGVPSRRAFLEQACESMKDVPTAEARQMIERIEATAGNGPDDPAVEASLLSWEQIEEMLGERIEVGSHTLDHPILAQLDASEARRQIVESRRRLEERLGRPIRWFSYPNGKAIDAGPPIRRMVREAGYEAAVSTIEGRVSRSSSLFWLERKGVPLGSATDSKGRFSESLFATEMSGLYDLLFQRGRRERGLH